jgi:hypothetical protein
VGLKLNGTHQLLAYADEMNLLGDDIDAIKKNTETLIDASKEVGLEINVAKPEYQYAGQNHDKENAALQHPVAWCRPDLWSHFVRLSAPVT